VFFFFFCLVHCLIVHSFSQLIYLVLHFFSFLFLFSLSFLVLLVLIL
jgi:hypothetical protein